MTVIFSGFQVFGPHTIEEPAKRSQIKILEVLVEHEIEAVVSNERIETRHFKQKDRVVRRGVKESLEQGERVVDVFQGVGTNDEIGRLGQAAF